MFLKRSGPNTFSMKAMSVRRLVRLLGCIARSCPLASSIRRGTAPGCDELAAPPPTDVSADEDDVGMGAGFGGGIGTFRSSPVDISKTSSLRIAGSIHQDGSTRFSLGSCGEPSTLELAWFWGRAELAAGFALALHLRRAVGFAVALRFAFGFRRRITRGTLLFDGCLRANARLNLATLCPCFSTSRWNNDLRNRFPDRGQDIKVSLTRN